VGAWARQSLGFSNSNHLDSSTNELYLLVFTILRKCVMVTFDPYSPTHLTFLQLANFPPRKPIPIT